MRKHLRFSGVAADAATTAAGVVRGSKLPAMYQVAQLCISTTLTTYAMPAGELFAARFRRPFDVNVYDRIMFRTSGAAGGARAYVAVYSEGTNGQPNALIWYSGDLDVSASATFETAFTAGTWVDTSFQSGNNLKIPQGNRVYLALFLNAVARSFQGLGGSSNDLVTLRSVGGGFFLLNRFYATVPPAYGVPPNTFGATTAINNDVILVIALRPVTP